MRWLPLFLIGLLMVSCGGSATPPPGSEPEPPVPARTPTVVNQSNPGEIPDLPSLLSKDGQTLVEFFSDDCPPCQQFVPLLERLAEERPDLTILKVDIDRAGTDGIDFDSPVAEQFNLDRVPYFILYDASGQMTMEGDQAREQVKTWMQQAGIVQ